MKESITAEYKKPDPSIIEKLNEEAYRYSYKYNVKGKIKKIEQKPAFITIKDHKKIFKLIKLNWRVLNPTKSPFNKFTKAKLDTISKRAIIGSKLNQ